MATRPLPPDESFELEPLLDVGGPDLPGDGAGRPAGPLASPPPSSLWWAAGALYRRAWLVALVGVLVAAGAVALTLQMPNRYRAEARVLLPESGGGLAGGLLDGLGGAAGLLGGGSGEFTRYMAILTSREMLEAAVERFDLPQAYGLLDEEYPEYAALSELERRATFVVSPDYDYLAVQVLDEDPDRAAQMANAFVERLNVRNAALTSAVAAENRRYLETRVAQAEGDLDAAFSRLQGVQERSGVVEPEAQATALLSALAAAQGAATRAEAEYAAVLTEYGPENPVVEAAGASRDAARAQIARLAGGSDAILPVPLRELPGVQGAYARATQEVTLQRTVLETLLPLYEQAVLRELKEADAVQVLDPAVPPLRKAEPRRSVLVVVATLSGLLLTAVFVVLQAWWRRNHAAVAQRLRSAVEADRAA